MAHSFILCKGISLDNNNFWRCCLWGTMLKFLSYKNHTPFLRYSAFYILNHFINFESYDFIMSIGTLASAQIIECIFWILSHLVIKLSHLIDTVMGPKLKPNFTILLQLIQNQLWWVFGFLVLCRCALRQSKIVNILLMTILLCTMTILLSQSWQLFIVNDHVCCFMNLELNLAESKINFKMLVQSTN